MTVNDILKLNNEIESLNIIQDFLNRSITYKDYEISIYMYLKIAFFNNLHDLVIKEGSKSLDKFKSNEPTKYRELIYSFMIDSSIQLKQFELTKVLINNRKELLPILIQYKSLLDELNLTKAMNQETLTVLIKLKNELIPNDVKIYVLEQLMNLYFNSNNYEKSLELLLELKELSLQNKYEIKLIEIKYLLNEFVEVVDLANDYIQNENNEESAKVVIYLIDSLIKLNKLRNASTLEAEYETIIDEIDDLEFKEFSYNILIRLYTLMNNNLSVDLYNKKLKKLKKKEPVKKDSQIEIVKEKIKIKEVSTQTLVSNAKYLEHFEWTYNWLIYSHNLDLKLSFREYLRSLFIKISEKINFKESIIYMNKNYESNLYNYKKERLYDKKIINELVDETIVKETLDKKESIFGEPKRLLSKKDILSQKEYLDDIKYVYSFYIDKDTVFVIYFDEDIIDPSLYYELLLGISYIVSTRIIDEANTNRLRKDGMLLDSLLNNNALPTRVLKEYVSKYNEKAVKLFNINSKEHIELFLRQIPLESASIYEKAVERLFVYPNEIKILEYKFNDLSIIEYMFAIKIDNEVSIYSTFFDVTNTIIKEEILKNKANVCNETNLDNKNQLLGDLPELLNQKSTFILVELNKELSSIYGNTQLDMFFIEFCNYTKKHFQNYKVYRYDYNQLMIVFDFNDIRTVNNELNNYFQVVNHLKSKVLKYEKFEAKAGALRYPVVTVDKDVTRLFKYVDVSLQKAKNSKDLDYVHFIQADYENQIFEQEIIDYLNTAIENKQLTIKFKQIIDVDSNTVWNYESILYLPNINIDGKYLNIIAKKRKKIVDLDLYHIEAVCSFLSNLVKETNHLIKLTIPISKETFLKNNFQSVLIGYMKKYNIRSEFIRILIDIKETTQADSLRISELIKYGISVDTTSVDTFLNNDFNAVHLKYNTLNHKSKEYLKKINTLLENNSVALIIRNVNSKETKELLKNIGIKYIEGELYQEITPEEIKNKIMDVI